MLGRSCGLRPLQNKFLSVVLLQILKSLHPASHLQRRILVPFLVGVFDVLMDSLVANGEILTKADWVPRQLLPPPALGSPLETAEASLSSH